MQEIEETLQGHFTVNIEMWRRRAEYGASLKTFTL